MNFIKDSLVTFSAQVLGVVFGLITTIIVARVLGPSGKGVYSLLVLINLTVSMLGNLGIGVASIYFGGSKKYSFSELASNSLISALIIGVPLSVLLLAYFFIGRPSFLGEADTASLVFWSAMIPVTLLGSYFLYILVGQKRLDAYNLVTVMQTLATVVLLTVAFYVLDAGLSGAVIGTGIANIVAAALSVYLVRRTTPVRWSFNYAIFKESVKFGIKGYVGNLMQMLNYRLNLFVIGFLMTTAAAGYFSVTINIGDALFLFPTAIGTVILARTPGLSADQANKSTPRICRTTLFVTAMLSLVFFVFARPVILLFFGPAFLPALNPTYILLPGIVMAAVFKVLANEMTGRGKNYAVTVIAGLSLIVTISLNLLLVPRLGLEGAALASTVSDMLGAVVALVLFVRISGARFLDAVLLTFEDMRLYRDGLLKAIRREYAPRQANQ